ncbi:MAG: hypothetical protein IJ228_01605 [Succinivibrio sp.]|nr:hypothetical protein [Succinivibrio sp.]
MSLHQEGLRLPGVVPTQGLHVTPEPTLRERFADLRGWLQGHSLAVALALSLLAALCVETFAFNYACFTFDRELYPYRTVELGGENYGGHRGILLTAEKHAVTVGALQLKVRSVSAAFWSPAQSVVHGTVSFTDTTSSKIPVDAAQFTVNPSSSDTAFNSSYNLIAPAGTVTGISVALKPQDIPGGAVLTALTLNAPPHFTFSLIRVGGMFLFLTLICTVRLRHWCRLETTPDESAEKWGSRTMLALALLACALLFSLINPATTQPLSLDFQGESNVIMTYDDHRLLIPLPGDEESLKRLDPYAQLLHAFVHKHQLNLDFTVDPKLLELDNPYDFGARAAAGVSYYFECAFKDGKYYLYYGLMPLLLLYLPCLLLTGCVPTPALACFLLAVPALLALYAALRSLRLTFPFKANTFLCLLTELTILCSCGIFILLVASRFYSLPRLCGIIFLSLFLAAVWSLPRRTTPRGLLLTLVLCSLCIPCIVLSSPNMLIFALALSAPLLLVIILRLCRRSREAGNLLPKALLSLFLPVIAGAAFVMWYNHARFGSVFDFGIRHSLTGYDLHETQGYNLRMLINVLYLYFFEPIEYVKNFPFVLPADRTYHDFGSYMFISNRISLFALPLMWGIFIVLFRWRKISTFPSPTNEPWNLHLQDRLYLLRLSGLLLLPVMVLMALSTFPVAGMNARYFSDYAISTSLVLFIPLLLHLHWSKESILRMFFMLVLIMIVKSLFIGMLYPLSYDVYELVSKLSPDEYIALGQFLTPLQF